MASLNPHIWLKHIESWKQSGMTQAQYCREHHLSAKAFYYWKTKAQRHEKAPEQNTPTVTAGFAVARIEQTMPTTGLSLSLPGGVTIHDIQSSNLSTVIQLLEALQ